MNHIANPILTVLTAVLLSASAAAAAAGPEAKCQAGKNQESGKYAFCLHKAEAKLLKTEGACSVTTATACYRDADCPMGETCVQADADSDGVGDPCDQCNGRDDDVCFCGDNILDIPSEQCDLGGQNGVMGSPCSSTCGVSGKCKGSGTVCTVAADCPMGQGCCGNDLVEANEACDDGNAIENDVCTSACDANPLGTPLVGCDDLVGPNVIPASVKVTKFKDTSDAADIDRWKAKGEFIFTQGLPIDPDTQPVKIIYNNTPSGLLFESQLDPADCIPTPCFVQNGVKTKWKFKDKEADLAGAPSWRKGKINIKNNKAKFTLDGRKTSLFTAAELGSPMGVARQTLRIGDVCVTAVIQCEAKGASEKCSLVPNTP